MLCPSQCGPHSSRSAATGAVCVSTTTCCCLRFTGILGSAEFILCRIRAACCCVLVQPHMYDHKAAHTLRGGGVQYLVHMFQNGKSLPNGWRLLPCV